MLKLDPQDQSSFEMLDDDDSASASAPAWPGRLDLLLGLAMLFVIAGIAGWQWWDYQSRASRYETAQKYAEQHRWDDARAAFLAAGSYLDARDRLAAVQQTIDRRDRTYSSALAEADRGEWARALRDWRSVQQVEPGFKDSQDRSYAAAEQVSSLALSGTVAFRPSAWPRGLYWYTARGWVWLMGSDTGSIVRGSGSSCCVVYDVPATGAMAAGLSLPGQAQPSGRRLMLARATEQGIIFKPLQAGLETFDSLVWDDSGTLALSNKRATQRLAGTPLGRVSILYPGMSLSYQPHDSGTAALLPSLDTPWALLALLPGGAGKVLGDYSRATGDTPQTSLYLSDAGGTRLPLAIRPALVQAVFPSPDNRYLLIDEYSPLPGGEEEHRLVVLWRGTGMGSATLATAKAEQPSYLDSNWYSVSFMTSGAYAGKVLIRGNPSRDGQLRLVDPAQPGQPLWSGQPPPGASAFVATSVDAGIFTSFVDWQNRDVGGLFLDAAGKAVDLRLVTGAWQSMGRVWQRGNRLVYSLTDSNGYGRGIAYSIRSVDLSDLGSAPSSALVLYDAGFYNTVQAASYGYDPGYWAPGPGMLAYIANDGSLHAKTYDDSIDLRLDDAVSALHIMQGK